MASSLLLILALISYSGQDPSSNVSSSTREYANYVGKVGAWTADFLFHWFGLAALLLPVPLLILGYKKLRGLELESPSIKLVAFSSLVASFTAALSLPGFSVPETVNFMPGGIVGILLSGLLTAYLNVPGALIVVMTVLVVSLLISTRFSLVEAVSWARSQNWSFFSSMTAWYFNWLQRRRGRKKLDRLKRDKQAVIARPAPKKVFLDEPLPLRKDHPARREAPGAPDADPSPPTVRVMPRPERAQSAQAPAENVFVTRPASTDRPYEFPPVDFLRVSEAEAPVDEQELLDRAQVLATKCAEFDVHGRVHQIHPGPVVTTFEFKPDPGIKYSKITNLADDLCLALKAECVRIDRIPGKNTVGIEVPNLRRQTIYLRELLEGAAFQQARSPLTLALGKLINGNTYVTDLARMPHLLIAGATGSGKSVALNGMVCSILYKASPSQVRFIMIDPKRLELGVYEDIPHLLTPIVTDPKQASNALNWAVSEMEGRYKLLAQEGVRNIDQYNKLILQTPEETRPDALPYVVIIVDELADLMMTAGKDVEAALTRLAQMARAIGIHLILATQRPSVDVLTGLIKANFPSRISFRVSSKVDSRTVLDCNGAEQLLGQGDMLFLPPGTARLIRIHGAFITEQEIGRITRFLKQQAQPEYQEEVLAGDEEDRGALVEVGDMDDELYEEAARFVVETGKASTSLLQRRLRIGYGRAARLLDIMEHEGIIGPPDGSKAREVRVPPDYFNTVSDI